jgi:tetratricopeptide (TPR) repeat protein
MTPFHLPPPASAEPLALNALGQRVRAARRLRHLRQEALVAPFLPIRVVRAVEQGRLLPSRAVFDLLADRLQIPAADLIGDLPDVVAGSDRRAMEADVAYQIHTARDGIETGSPAEALQRLTALAQAYQACWEHFSPATRYDFYYSRAVGYCYLGSPEAAREELAQAAQYAAQIPGGFQFVEQVRNALGATYYQQDRPAEALAHYTRCLTAIHGGIVEDGNLRLAIHTNLAHAYRALHQYATAIRVYKDAQAVLCEVSNWKQQVAIYAGLSLAYQALNDLDQARLYALRALAVYEARAALLAPARETARAVRPLSAVDRVGHALLQIHLAELRVARQEWPAAAALLEQARAGLEATPGSEALLSCVYAHLALVHLECGDISTAAAWATESVERVIPLFAAPPATRVTLPRLHWTHARALQAAALVAERQAQPAQSDVWFRAALALVEHNGPRESAYEVLFSYAETLSARGAHAEAVRYYQAAVRQRPQAARPCSVLDTCGRGFGWPQAAL